MAQHPEREGDQTTTLLVPAESSSPNAVQRLTHAVPHAYQWIQEWRKWIQKKRSRRLVIYPLFVVALAYLAVGLVMAVTYHDWKPTDTFSMVAGCLFFVIGTGLAVTHEIRQETEQDILINQGYILAAVQHDVKKVLDLAPLQRLPGKPKEREVQLDEPPVELETARNLTGPSDSAALTGIQPPMPVLTDLTDVSPVIAAMTGLDLAEGSDEKKQVLGRFALESAIEANAGDAAVRDLLKSSEVFVLGEPAGDTSVPGEGTESEILYFTVDDADGQERVLMPIFTRPEVMRSALLRNPDWQSLFVLQVNGGDLLTNLDSDVTPVIDPWSPLEFQLSGETGPEGSGMFGEQP